MAGKPRFPAIACNEPEFGRRSPEGPERSGGGAISALSFVRTEVSALAENDVCDYDSSSARRSIGVMKSYRLRGRVLSLCAMALHRACVSPFMLWPFGRY